MPPSLFIAPFFFLNTQFHDGSVHLAFLVKRETECCVSEYKVRLGAHRGAILRDSPV